MRVLPASALLLLPLHALFPGTVPAQEATPKTGADLRASLADEAAAFWVYDDLQAATAKADKSGKPLLVTFRCVP